MNTTENNLSVDTSLGLNDHDFMRYSRQILLPELGEAGQITLSQSHVIVIGVGGLGTLVAHYLAAAGVGHLTLVDADTVSLSNLPRQLLFCEQDIGVNKAVVAKQKLTAAYPDIVVTAVESMFSDQLAATWLQMDAIKGENTFSRQPARTAENIAQGFNHHLAHHGAPNGYTVLDCSDNLSTRHSVNRFCVAANHALVSAAVAHFEGQLFAFAPLRRPKSGCYHCLYPEDTQLSQTCATIGVLGPMVGVMASMQSLLALNLLLDNENPNSGRLWRFDGKRFTWTSALLSPDPLCPVCSEALDYTDRSTPIDTQINTAVDHDTSLSGFCDKSRPSSAREPHDTYPHQ